MLKERAVLLKPPHGVEAGWVEGSKNKSGMRGRGRVSAGRGLAVCRVERGGAFKKHKT